MTPAQAAYEYRSNVGNDFSMIDALDPEYLDTDETPEVDETAERQRLNQFMFDYFNG